MPSAAAERSCSPLCTIRSPRGPSSSPSFFFPILLGTFFQQLYNTVDAIIVGNFVGTAALGAVGGPTAVLINFLVNLFVGLSSGATVVIAQYYGARQGEDLREAVHTGIAPGGGRGHHRRGYRPFRPGPSHDGYP